MRHSRAPSAGHYGARRVTTRLLLLCLLAAACGVLLYQRHTMHQSIQGEGLSPSTAEVANQGAHTGAAPQRMAKAGADSTVGAYRTSTSSQQSGLPARPVRSDLSIGAPKLAGQKVSRRSPSLLPSGGHGWQRPLGDITAAPLQDPSAKALLSSQDQRGAAIASVATFVIDVLSPVKPAPNLERAVAANLQRQVTVQVSLAAGTLSAIRLPVMTALGLQPGQGFRFLVWDSGGSCLQPLSQWEETQETPGQRSDGELLVAFSGSLGLPEGEQWPPLGIVFWRRHKPLPPGGRLAAYANGHLGVGVVCKRWAAEQHLHMRIGRERSFWIGIGKPPPLGDPTPWAVESMARDSMQYFGWHEGVEKHDAALVVRGGWDWSTMFASTRPGYQLLMRHPHNNNLTAKDLLFWNLRNAARQVLATGHEAPCIAPAEIVPETYLTDDPEDCARLLKAIKRRQGETWVRKVADLHVGQGITPVTQLQPSDCPRVGSGAYERRSKVVYQGKMEPLKVDGRPISLRSYVLVASMEPLVLVFNHQAGHVYIAGKQVMQSSKAWYTQHHSFEAWTFERFDHWLSSSMNRPGFFREHTLPKMKDAILSGLKAARASFTHAEPRKGDGIAPRIWDTGHELGSLGHFDLWCIDFMYDEGWNIRMLEMTDSCLFKGYREQDQVKQRTYLMKDALELTISLQSRILQHLPILDLFPSTGWRGSPATRAGNFELLYSEVPGSEYDYFEAEQRCRQQE